MSRIFVRRWSLANPMGRAPWRRDQRRRLGIVVGFLIGNREAAERWNGARPERRTAERRKPKGRLPQKRLPERRQPERRERRQPKLRKPGCHSERSAQREARNRNPPGREAP